MYDNTLTKFSQNNNMDFTKVLVHNIVFLHCILAMTEKGRKYLDKDGVSGALLTDLSKTFDSLLHDLLIAKLAAYGFDYESLTLIQSCLWNRQQRNKVNNTYSTFSDIIFGVPQGLIIDPLLFNIYICDMFMIIMTVISQAMQMTIRPTAVALAWTK